MDTSIKKNTMTKYVTEEYEDIIINNLRTLIYEKIGFEIINEFKSKDLGSMKVSVKFERDSYETTNTMRNYYVITLYIDKSYSNTQHTSIRRNFLNDLRRMLELNYNNIGSIHRVYIAGTETIEVNEKIEGYKVLLALHNN